MVYSRRKDSQLGLEVDPAQVRLIPAEEDPYEWNVQAGYENLFEKHLSKLSIGPLMRLCRGIGIFFHAARPNARKALPNTPSEFSSTADIETLKTEKESLAQQLDEWKKRAEKAEKQRDALGTVLQKLQRDSSRRQLIIAKSRSLMINFIREADRECSVDQRKQIKT